MATLVDVHASIQPGVGCYNKNSDRSRGLVEVVATIQGLTELKYRATLSFLTVSASLCFTYLEIAGWNPVTGTLVCEKFVNFNL